MSPYSSVYFVVCLQDVFLDLKIQQAEDDRVLALYLSIAYRYFRKSFKSSSVAAPSQRKEFVSNLSNFFTGIHVLPHSATYHMNIFFGYILEEDNLPPSAVSLYGTTLQ